MTVVTLTDVVVSPIEVAVMIVAPAVLVVVKFAMA
jgi:hypothetical protein